MRNTNKLIKNVEISSIHTKEKDLFIVQAIIDSEMIEFEFHVVYQPEVNANAIERSEKFFQISRDNPEFEDSIYKLISRSFHEEKLVFPIKLTF